MAWRAPVQTTGNAVLRHLLQAAYDEIDAEVVARYRQQPPPGAVRADGYEPLTWELRTAKLVTPQAYRYLSGTGEALLPVVLAPTLAAVAVASRQSPVAQSSVLIQATQLLGAAAALREATGAALPPVDRPDHEATMASVRAALGETALAAAWAAGRALTIEQAVAEALNDVDVPPQEHAAATPAPPAGDGLTAREVEVLRLLAAGRSNREIAADLSVSVRTVERHVGNLYLKIDAHGRADATAFAFRHGLV